MRTYSTYEAKARFSEILRKVRGGESVSITYRGTEVAEIRPIAKDDTIERRLERLESARVIQPASKSPRRAGLEPVTKSKGALDRFLESQRMKLAYVDTSCLVAIAFGEEGHAALVRRLEGFDRLASSNLAEAELRAAFRREDTPGPERLLAGIDWVFPDRPLTEEYEQVLAVDYVRGADLFHLACALFLRGHLGELVFETVDARQKNVASLLGF